LGKIVVHFLNKGGGGEEEGVGYLGETLHGEEREREWPTIWITGGGNFLEREMKEKRKKKKERRMPDRTGLGGGALASLVPYSAQRAPARLAPFLSTWCTPSLAGWASG
jgi:hypothetical protein